MQRRQRHRISYTCSNCRAGKHRCDRQKPCSSCLRRDKQSTCQYDNDGSELSLDEHRSWKGGKSASRFKETESLLERQSSPIRAQSTPDLGQLGYSKFGNYNALGVIQELAGSSTTSPSCEEKTIGKQTIRELLRSEKYLGFLRQIPPRPYVNALVDVFFAEVNWQYSILDRNFFVDQVQDFYNTTRDPVSEERVKLQIEFFHFPVLLFQVIASALQFLPSDHDRILDDLCMGRSFDDLSKSYSDLVAEFGAVFEKGHATLISVQAGSLRVPFLKTSGRVLEAWHALGDVVIDAEEIGLHREDKRTTENVEDVCSWLWSAEVQRRVVLNLVIWDREMGLLLGKSFHINEVDWTLIAPLDAHIPLNRKSTIPSPRASYEIPTTFTHRLLEYELCKRVPKVSALQSERLDSRTASNILVIHRETLQYIEYLPPAYRFSDPDTTWDKDCPWLVRQREYLCTITYLFIVMLHRSHMFLHTQSQSRTEVLRAAINILNSQAREFKHLQPHHYKLFTLAFFTLEGATAALAVLISFPGENGDLLSEALTAIRKSVLRLNAIRSVNSLAGTSSDVIQGLLLRVESQPIQNDEKRSINLDTPVTAHGAKAGLLQAYALDTAGTSLSERKEDESIAFPELIHPFPQTEHIVNVGSGVDAADCWDLMPLNWKEDSMPTDLVRTGYERWKQNDIISLCEKETFESRQDLERLFYHT